jgi:hypothetical protein
MEPSEFDTKPEFQSAELSISVKLLWHTERDPYLGWIDRSSHHVSDMKRYGHNMVRCISSKSALASCQGS